MIIFMSPLFALAAQQVIALVAATFDYIAPLIYLLPVPGTILFLGISIMPVTSIFILLLLARLTI